LAPPFERLVIWAHRRRRFVLAGAALLVAVAALGLPRLTFDPDVLGLLPRRGTAVPAFREYLQHFGTLDDLYIVFSTAEGHDIRDDAEAIDAWVDALRAAPELTRVDSGQIDGSRDWGWLADRQLLLFDSIRLPQALARLQPGGMPAALASTRELLSLPSADITALVREDPLGLSDLLRAQLGGSRSALQIGTSPDGYLTADGRQRLIIARPKRPPFDADFSRALFARLDAIAAERAGALTADDGEPRPPVQVTFAGGHRIALEAEAVVKRESLVNGLGSLALILPLLFITFRSAWLVFVGALPSSVSLLVVLGLLGFSGATLSAAATGASAMLFGLGVDGVVLLYVTHRLALAEGRSPDEAIRSLAGPSASMLLGMWTTAATFLGLVVVDFPSLEQLGLLIGLSMIVCGVLTLVMVPASLSSRAPQRRVRALRLPRLAVFVQKRRRAVLVVAALVTVLSGYFATMLRVNPTLERLRSVTPGASELEKVTNAFALPEGVLVVLAKGRDLQALLEANETLMDRLRARVPSLVVQAPSALLPSERTQRERLDAIVKAVPAPGAVRAALEQSGVEAGFRPQSFAGFAARLDRMLDGSQRLTREGFEAHGLGDVMDRLIVPANDGWLLATYAFPASTGESDSLRAVVDAIGGGQVVTGLPLVNEEMSASFLPQFVRGLGVGSAIVVALILVTFRDWRLALLTLVPTAIGLLWAAGILGLVGFELDLFSVFAVVTFVGIGVDYGVHLVHRYCERADAVDATAALAPVILVAGAITLLGYGTLIGSSYPPLQSIGVVSAVSVVTLVAASVFVLPALLARHRA
jgi:uncharacterized protein